MKWKYVDMLFADKEKAQAFLDEIDEETKSLQQKKENQPVAVDAGKRIFFQGHLTKQGNSVKSWRKRWFELKNNLLKYYRYRIIFELIKIQITIK